MKKLSTLLILLSLYSSLSAQNPTTDLDNKIDSLINKLTRKVATVQYLADYHFYPELAYLRDKYQFPNLLKNDTVYINKLNDYYYKRVYPFSKLMDTSFIITEDCITDLNENKNTIDAYDLQIYALYNNIKLPDDYFERLETTSHVNNNFLDIYYTLKTIYFLKQFNSKQLSTLQLKKSETIEHKLSRNLFDNYINNKEWNFYKVASVAVLLINKNELVKNIDLNPLFDLYLNNGQPEINILDNMLVESDRKDSYLMGSIGYNKVLQLHALNLMWIISTKKY